jgi:8-oxo-dGTP diphosphatase
MSARDGDGWIHCECGNKHWGLYGAAGLLLYRDQSILLQHRAPWVHNGDTWGIPGGARDSHESATESAIREAMEETGIDADLLHFKEIFSDPHGSWSYETIIAQADPELVARELNDESHEVRWVGLDDVTRLPLHPSFAKSWPLLRIRLDYLITPG